LDDFGRQFTTNPVFLKKTAKTTVTKWLVSPEDYPVNGGIIVAPQLLDFGVIKFGCWYVCMI